MADCDHYLGVWSDDGDGVTYLLHSERNLTANELYETFWDAVTRMSTNHVYPHIEERKKWTRKQFLEANYEMFDYCPKCGTKVKHMSLDVTLYGETETVPCTCCDCGHKHTRTRSAVLYDDNITHNLNRMAEAAGIYRHLWRPDEIGVTVAGELIEPLEYGLNRLKLYPTRFKTFNPENGWGDYKGLVSFVERYLEACKQHPTATVSVSR